MKLTEKTISSQMLHKGKVVNLRIDSVELPNGKLGAREVVEHSGAVAVVPVTASGEVLMVRQFRYPAQKELLEIPAGKLDPGESPEECVKRELLEETGMNAGNITKLFSCYSSPGFSDEVIHIYLATDLKYHGQQLDEDEFVEIEKFKFDEIVDKVYNGTIQDAKTIAGILAAVNKR
ncbi:MAG: NUDIX hydrolase [Firmicutes bacterium]|nr:NUDIX hydrolase [Bacillota bacterium]